MTFWHLFGTKPKVKRVLLLPEPRPGPSAEPKMICHPKAGNTPYIPLSALKKGLNTYAGGVLSDLIRPHKPPKSYWTRMPSAQPHWSPCGLVFISPVYVITDQELDSLDTAHFTAAYQGTMPEELEHLKDRRNRSSTEPLTTRTHPSTVWTNPFTTSWERRYTGMRPEAWGPPILLHRKPAVFEDTMMPSSTLLSAAQALYRTDAGIVPVVTAQNRPGLAPTSHRKITSLRFETTPGQTSSQGPITAVEHITMQFHLEQDSNPNTVPAPFMMQGDDENEFQVQFVPHMTSPEDLEHHIIQAYRSYDDTIPKDLRQEELGNLTAKVKDLMEQAIPFFG